MKRLPTKARLHTLTLRDGAMVCLGIVLAGAAIGLKTIVKQQQTPLSPETTHIAASWIPSTVKHWEGPIDAMAKKYNIDPTLLAIVMTLESGGDATANSGQARGLMQLTPATASDIATKFLKQPTSSYDITKPATNIEFGAAYLAYLRDTFGDSSQGPSWISTVELIAAGYNGGPKAANSVYKGTGLTDTQTVVYARDAFNMWRERHAATSPTYDRWLERGGSSLVAAAKLHQQ